MSDRDKRQNPRIAATFKVEYESFDKFLHEYAEDISQGGIFLATDSALPVGTVVRLILHLPESVETVQVIGQVVHHRSTTDAQRMGKKPGMGVEFIDIDGLGLRQVKAFVEARIKVAPRPALPAGERVRLPPIDAVVACADAAISVVLERALSPRFQPRLAPNGLRALSECIRLTPKLILALADLPGMSGLELLRVARERGTLAAVPFVLVGNLDEGTRLAAFRTGADDVVAWPVPDEELAARIDRILQRAAATGLGDRRALRGELGLVSIASLFGLLEMERKSGYLLLVREGETALVGFREGQVVRADVRPVLRGRDKVFYVLDWAEGRFEFVSQDVGTGDEIATTTSHLLLAHAQRKDELAAGRLQRG